jgi:hypothetical protein
MAQPPPEDKIVFALSPAGDGDGVPMLLLGVPRGAWEHMKDGKTHTFDLTHIGIPLKLMLYGAANHAAAMQMIEAHIDQTGETLFPAFGHDFSIKPKG